MPKRHADEPDERERLGRPVHNVDDQAKARIEEVLEEIQPEAFGTGERSTLIATMPRRRQGSTDAR